MFLLHCCFSFTLLSPFCFGNLLRASQEMSNSEKAPDFRYYQTERRISDSNCQCGVQRSTGNELFSPWILYVHLTISPTETRTCVATVISSNIILTSHNCGFKGGKEDTTDFFNVYQEGATFIDLKDLTVNDHPNKDEGTTSYAIIDILANPRYGKIFREMTEVPVSDYMVIVVDHDFTERDSMHKPICLPFSGELTSYSSIGLNVTYGNSEGNEIYDLKIKDGRDCDQDGSLKLSEPGTEDIFCVTVTHKFVTIEEGQPLYVYINLNPYTPTTYTFLLGVSAMVKQMDDETHLFFIHINAGIKQLELELTSLVRFNTFWCPQPWPWIKASGSIERDESLDCECGIPRNRTNGQVVGYNEAFPYEFPWMAKLDLIVLTGKEYRRGICGGAVISDRIVLTAAHCIVSHDLLLHESTGYDVQGPNQTYKVFLRSHKRINDSWEIELDVKLGIVHPGYVDGERRDRSAEHDLALLILERPLNFSAIGADGVHLYRPVCLPKWGETLEVIGKEAIASGWGLATTIRGNKSLADVLQKVAVAIEPLQVCKDLFKHQIGLTYNSVICGGLDFTKNTNAGDSGGPVVVKELEGKYTQVGVVSYALSKYNKKNEKIAQTTFFADVQELLPWVDYYSDLYKAKYCKKGS